MPRCSDTRHYSDNVTCELTADNIYSLGIFLEETKSCGYALLNPMVYVRPVRDASDPKWYIVELFTFLVCAI